MRQGLLMGTSLLVAGASVWLGTPAADAMVGNYLSYFNTPSLAPTHFTLVIPSQTIQNKLLEYINGATPGSEIRGHITRISKKKITDALISAHKRGVEVFLVQDGTGFIDPGSSPQGDRLEAYFGTRHKYCHLAPFDQTSCVSSLPFATHHIKNWLFSNTVVGGVTRTYSSWVTSYNLTYTSDKQFNDAFVVNDNYDLYAAYERSFRHFYGQRRSTDFYNVAGRGHHIIPSANVEISYAPQTTSPGHPEYHPTNDQVAMALSRIDAYETGCALRVAMLTISHTRSAIIDELLRIKALGCRVQIAYSDATENAISQLTAGGIELRCGRWPDCSSEEHLEAIHSKMALYNGTYDGAPSRTMVWGGSHNWTMGSLRRRDEVFVAISRLGISRSYKEYFDVVWASSTPVP